MEEHANYRYFVDDNIVAIEDLFGPVSVTQDAEHVFLELQQQIGSLENKYVIWKDREERWDGLEWLFDRLLIYPIGARSYEDAKHRIRNQEVTKGSRWLIKDDTGIKAHFDRGTIHLYTPQALLRSNLPT